MDLQDGFTDYRQEFAFYSPERRLTLALPSPFLRSMPTRLILEEGEVGTTRSWQTVEVASYEEAFKRELLEFHEAIVSGRSPRTDGIDGLRDVALCQALVHSHMRGAAVELRPEDPSHPTGAWESLPVD